MAPEGWGDGSGDIGLSVGGVGDGSGGMGGWVRRHRAERRRGRSMGPEASVDGSGNLVKVVDGKGAYFQGVVLCCQEER
ncbi:Hypothetical protein CAP_4010 [Chondromyces apiculatus DSM 436]|uniref:Uncharacterized protein n=1 Tax=Chondromyces apiculatus DSM 436 TaxID=1192034 RepID=A0A017TIN7_9BACT|nr:Hypothetical protein CAP_4010 [Chondromyces apiculatus DSM 436]